MKLTVLTADERIVSLDVEADELVENLKAILEVETGIPLSQQQILHNGKEISSSGRLNAAGVVENDLLMLVSTSPRAQGGNVSRSVDDLRLNNDGSAVNPVAFLNNLRGNANLMAELKQKIPELGLAINRGDYDALQKYLRQYHEKIRLHQQRELELMNADPFDVEAQKRIEDAIRQKNIDENWETAVEHNPEAFVRVGMLYVNMEVNGVPIKAFVDSGAQMTIVSKECAERCGLLRLLDDRYSGIARGVGQSKILGRVHVAPLKIGINYYPCTFSVIDQPDVEFIFGLDMLRKHQCSIDLKDNVLRVGGGEIAVPFLAESEIPAQFFGDEKLISSPSASGSGKSVPVQNPATATSASGDALKQSEAQEAKKRARSSQDLEAKIGRLMELGFDKETVTRALMICNGNEEQAAGFLFGG